MSKEELQIVERARKYRNEALTNLHQFIDKGQLISCYTSMNKRSSPGVDGVNWSSYGKDLPDHLTSLLARFKTGAYRAPSIRRVYIPKGKEGKRPLGIPTIEDKVLQESVRRVLSPVYEAEFKSFSYGFRQGRSAHHALKALYEEVSYGGMHYIIDADIKNYFGSISHSYMRDFLDLRVKDGVIRKMLDKWLKAGIMEEGYLSYPSSGTPQGGVISPLLSNIYLHYVLDLWFSEQIQPLLKGRSFIIRYADDFVLGFSYLEDAQRVMEVLPKRFRKYDLELHPEKTKIVNLNSERGKGSRGFDFLGFTHYLGRTRKGLTVLKRKTSSKKLSQSLMKTEAWIKKNRHSPLIEIITELNVKLRGHYSYYGISFNMRGIIRYYIEVKRILRKWLNRRGGKSVWTWLRYHTLVTEWLPLLKPRIYQRQFSAKPI